MGNCCSCCCGDSGIDPYASPINQVAQSLVNLDNKMSLEKVIKRFNKVYEKNKVEIDKAVLNQDQNPDGISLSKTNMLHFACQYQVPELVKLVIEKLKIKVTHLDALNRTALDYLCYSLVSDDPQKKKDYFIHDPKNILACLKLLLSHYPNDQIKFLLNERKASYPPMQALADVSGDKIKEKLDIAAEMFELMIQNGLEIFETRMFPDLQKTAALFQSAASNGNSKMLDLLIRLAQNCFVTSDHEELIKFLNLKDKNGRSAMDYAMLNDRKECVELLRRAFEGEKEELSSMNSNSNPTLGKNHQNEPITQETVVNEGGGGDSML
jgi:hypothetical protein